jgi:hypothetical protein
LHMKLGNPQTKTKLQGCKKPLDSSHSSRLLNGGRRKQGKRRQKNHNIGKTTYP